jgi:hypothetical protein
MRSRRNTIRTLGWLLASVCVCAGAHSARAQISPAEITDPQLKAAEKNYYSQLLSLYRAIGALKTPFPLQLSPFVGLDPSQQPEADSRGLAFVHFQDQLLLKISGNYNAAYSAERLTQNQRAGQTLSGVIAPILSQVTKYIPEDVACDGIGFEIAYHVRTASQNFDYEGKEILVVVFSPADAFAFARAVSDSARQEILNRSQVYLDGKPFGLALGQQNPLDLEAIGKSVPAGKERASNAKATRADSAANSNLVNPKFIPPRVQSAVQPSGASSAAPTGLPDQHIATNLPATPALAGGNNAAQATAADAERVQSQFQAQLDALAILGQAKFHFVDYAPPSFVVYRDQVVLQMTLRNTLHFAADSGSIYKRAAQSFDLFLALQLKDLLDKAPAEAAFDGYDITVLNQLGSDPHASSEAIEFISPRRALREFADADVTNQQLIDESIVLVNSVRIALDLQTAE